MPRHIIHQLTITAFAGFLVMTTLGMVITVSADRSEVFPKQSSIDSLETPVIPIVPYTFPVVTEAIIERDIISSTSSIEFKIAPAPLPVSAIEKISPVQVAPKNNVPQIISASITKSDNVATPQTILSFEAAFNKRIFDLTNQFRINEGLPPLKLSPALSKNATNYSVSMMKNKRLSHTDVKGCDLTCRFKRDGYISQSWGENLAHYSFSDEPTVEDVAQFFMKEWIKSAGHRANLVSSKYTETGIGITKNDHTIYVAVHFSLPF